MAVQKTKTKKKENEIKEEIKPKADVFDTNGEKTGAKILEVKYFGQKKNNSLLNQALRVYSFNLNKTTANTKTRGEVSGGGRKPWKQKGTGRARQGSTRAPHWRGGGVVFGPRTKNVSLKLPTDYVKKALYISLSDKAKNGKIRILNNGKKTIEKTKGANILLQKIYEDAKMRNVLLIYTNVSKNLVRNFRNLNYLTLVNENTLNAFYITKHDEILFLEDAFKKYDK